MVFTATDQVILKFEGLQMKNLAPMNNCPRGGLGVQGKLNWPQTNIIQVKLMKHDPLDMIYSFMLSKVRLIHIYEFGV